MLKVAIKNEPGKTEERQRFLGFLKNQYDLTDLDYSGVATTLFIEEKVKKIFAMAAELLHVSANGILSMSKRPNIVLTRDIICIILRCRYDMNYIEIGKCVGFSNGTGAILACRKFYIDDERELKELYKELSLAEIFKDAEERREKLKIERRQKCTNISRKSKII